MVEAAIIMIAFLLLIFGLIDLARGIFRSNQLSQAARHGVRQAIVHGEYAPAGWNGGPWGPTKIDVSADAAGTPIVDAVQPMLVGCDLAKCRIQVEWLESNNAVEKKVRVTVTMPFQPLLTGLLGSEIKLGAASTMTIAH